jgi:two-component system NtrC family sensor kinase
MARAVKKQSVKKSASPALKKPKDLKKLQELLEIVSRAKYMWEATFDAIHEPVMIIDKNYNIERANLAAADRCGHAIRELIGKKCYRIFAEREAVCPHCPLQKTLEGERGSVEIDALRPDGDFEVNSYPLKSHGAVHHYHEITEQKRLQRKLIQSEKMAAIGMLAGGVAHEINNPLAGILAFTQLLQKELPAEGSAHEDLKEIENAAKRCKKIVEDLLTFARPGGGERELLSLQEEVEKILPLARLNLRHRNVVLATDYEAALPKIVGNGPRLQQVFLNLVNNASQSMSSGGEVRLRIRKGTDEKQVYVEVSDQGCGIKKEDLSKIFDPFFTTKGQKEGTGLGLSVCYSIIAEHGGKIEVESEEGRGSLFRCVLPY